VSFPDSLIQRVLKSNSRARDRGELSRRGLFCWWIAVHSFCLFVPPWARADSNLENASSLEASSVRGAFFRSDDEESVRDVAADLFRENLGAWQEVLLKELLEQVKGSKAKITARLVQQRQTSSEVLRLFDAVVGDLSEAVDVSQVKEDDDEQNRDPLAILLSAYAAFQLRGDTDALIKDVPPILKDLDKVPELSALARQTLGAALIRVEQYAEARAVIEPLTLNGGSGLDLTRGTQVLSLLLLGDAHFFQFQYRSAHQAFVSAQQLMATDSAVSSVPPQWKQAIERYGPHLRLRLLWSAYRSGLYQEGLTAFQQVCLQDSAYWQLREPAFLSEMMRVGGAILYEDPKERERAFLLRDPLLQHCMSGASWALLDKLFRVGRFAEVVDVFRAHQEEFLSLRSAPLLAELAASAADRDRPGIDPEAWMEIVERSAEVLRRTGSWSAQQMRRSVSESFPIGAFNTRDEPVRLEAVRKGFIQVAVGRAASIRYETAINSGSRSDALLAAHLLAVVLEDADGSEWPHLEFRRGVVLAQGGSSAAAERSLRRALEAVLTANDEQIALETLSSLLEDRFRSTPESAVLEDWSAVVSSLIARYPGSRSQVHLLTVAQAWMPRSKERTLALLKRSLGSLSVSARPDEVLTSGFAQLAIRSVGSVDDLGYFEDVFRNGGSKEGLALVEQSHYALAAERYRDLRDRGLEREAIDWLEGWVTAHPRNAFRTVALEELMERNLRLGRYGNVYASAQQVLRETSGKTGLARVHLILAMATEHVKGHDAAARAYLTAFQQSESGDSSRGIAALALADRFSGWMDAALEPDVVAAVYQAAVESERASFNVHLRGLRVALKAFAGKSDAGRLMGYWTNRLGVAATAVAAEDVAHVASRVALWLNALIKDGFAAAGSLELSDADLALLGEESLQIVGQILDLVIDRSVLAGGASESVESVSRILAATPPAFLSLGALSRFTQIHLGEAQRLRNAARVPSSSAQRILERLGSGLVRAIIAHRKLRYLSPNDSLDTFRILYDVVVLAGYELGPSEALDFFGHGTEALPVQIPKRFLEAMEKDLKHELR
jgi:hypothetical protein